MSLHRVGASVVMCVVAACTNGREADELHDTLEEVRHAMQMVRPKADLDGIQAGLWTDRIDLRDLLIRARSDPWYLDLDRILECQGPSLVQLQVLRPESLEQIREEFGSIDPTLADADGIAFPAAGMVFVDADSAASVEVVSHEFAHVASYQRGYERKARPRISLVASTSLDPDWIDLDALVCVWALSEGGAQFTAKACSAYLGGGSGAVRAFWKKTVEVDVTKAGPAITGPATIQTSTTGTIKIKAGETYHLPPVSVTQVLTYLAYEGSLATVQAYREGNADLERTLERMWTRTSLTTRELLSPRTESMKSTLAGRAREQGDLLSAGAVGAFRVGALFLSWMLVDKVGMDWRTSVGWAGSLEDDLCLRMKPSGLVWITRWSESDRAKEFARIYMRLAPSAQVQVMGRQVVVTLGDVADADALVKALSENNRPEHR